MRNRSQRATTLYFIFREEIDWAISISLSPFNTSGLGMSFSYWQAPSKNWSPSISKVTPCIVYNIHFLIFCCFYTGIICLYVLCSTRGCKSWKLWIAAISGKIQIQYFSFLISNKRSVREKDWNTTQRSAGCWLCSNLIGIIIRWYLTSLTSSHFILKCVMETAISHAMKL